MANTTIEFTSPLAEQPFLIYVGSYFQIIPNVVINNPVGPTVYRMLGSGAGLPIGLNINPNTGTISGIPTIYTSTTWRATIRVTNNDGYAERAILLTFGKLSTTLNWKSPTAGNFGTANGGSYFKFVSVTSVVNPYGPTTYSLLSGILPAGTTLNPSNGEITGTLVNSTSTYLFEIRATNNGVNADRTFYGNVKAQTIVKWNSPTAGYLGSWVAGSSFSLVSDVSVENAVGSTTYSISSGKLPVGIRLDLDKGIISGTLPNLATNYRFTIRATNNGVTADRLFNFVVNTTPTSINWNGPASDLGTLEGGLPFNFTADVTVTNPVGATTYALVSGKLPTGTILDKSKGIISGTLPNIPATYSFTISANNNGKTEIRAFYTTIVNSTTVTWNGPASDLGILEGGSPFNFIADTTVTNGVGATTYSLVTGAGYGPLPAGTILNPNTGVITGTVANSNSAYSFAIRATNNGIAADRIFTGTIAAKITSIVWGPESNLGNFAGESSFNFSANTTVTNGVGATTYSLVPNYTLPAGLILNPTSGTIAGTVSKISGQYEFRLRATNNGVSADQPFTFTVIGETVVTLTSPSNPEIGGWTTGSSVIINLSADVINPVGATTFSIDLGPQINDTYGQVGTLSGANNIIDSNEFPPGLFLNASTGIISGIMTNPLGYSTGYPFLHRYFFALRATNNGISDATIFWIDLLPTIPVTSIVWNGPASDLGPWNGGTSFNFVPDVTVTNGVGETTYSLVAADGPLPAGTILDPVTGIITGTLENTTANYSFTIRATNNGVSANRTFNTSVTTVVLETTIIWLGPASELGTLNGGSSFNFISNTSVTNPVGATTYSLVTGVGYGPLPAGTTLDANTGIISGTLTNTTSTYSFTIRATNNGAKADRNFTTSVAGATIVTWNSPASDLGTLVGGSSFNFVSNTTVTNPVGVTTYSLVTGVGYGPLPAGTNLNPNTGVISGTLSNITSAYSFTIRATNNGAKADRLFTTSVAGVTIVAWNGPASDLGTLNGGSSFNFISNTSVTNPVGATTYSLVTGVGYGPLPAGTTLDSNTGVISGILSNTTSTYSFTIRATNNGAKADRLFTTSVAGVTIVAWNRPSSDLGTLNGGTPFNFVSNTTVTNPVGVTTYSLVTGAGVGYGPLPAGTALDSNTGIISGTLSNITSSYSFTIRATNNGVSANRTFSTSIVGATIVTWNNPPSGNMGTVAGGSSFNFVSNTSVINPVGVTTYSLVTGAGVGYGPLPAGTALDSNTGIISGTLSNITSSYSFTIRATNNGVSANRTFGLSVTDTNTYITWNGPATDLGTLTGGDAFNFISNTTVIKPVGTTIYSLVTGAGVGYGPLPAGTTLNPNTGVISGILTTYNVNYPYSFTIRATNNGVNADRTFTTAIAGKITSIAWNSPSNLGTLTGGDSFNLISNTTVINPVGSTTYSLVTGVGYGPLPAGTTLNPNTGVISGTLTNISQNLSFTLRATNGLASSVRAFTGTVVGIVTSVTWNSPVAGRLDDANGGSLFNFISNTTVTNPVGATTYTRVSGTLPAGTILDANTGVISGTLSTPTTTTGYSFTLRATNNGVAADRNWAINIIGTSVTWNSPVAGRIGDMNGGSSFNFISNTTVINPVGTTTYTRVVGTLPAGTTLDSNTGIISGILVTPATTTGYGFTLRATNNGVGADRNWAINIIGTSVTWNSPAPSLGTVNGGATFNLVPDVSVTNPVGATTYSIVTGTLPDGTILNPTTGAISGTLAVYQTNYNRTFTIRATNNGAISDRIFTITVTGKPTSVIWNNPAPNLGTFTGGNIFNLVPDVSVINPVGTTTYARVSGTLPYGTTLNPTTGVITGILATYQYDYPFSFTIRATNGSAAADRIFTGTVIGKPTSVIWNSPAAGNFGTFNGGATFNLVPDVSVTNPVGATTYSLVTGTLPYGTTLNTTSGTISGTLTRYNFNTPYSFTIRATNNGKFSDRLFTGTVIGTTITWNSPNPNLGAFSGGDSFNVVPDVSVINPVGITTYSLVTGVGTGPLPYGTTLNPTTGVIAGTLTTYQTDYPFSFTIRATNGPASADRIFTGTVIGKPTSVIWNSPDAGNFGTFNGGATFNFVPNVSVTNPVGATTYSIVTGNVPVGTTLNPSTGVISGTLTRYAANTPYSFTVRATNNGKWSDRLFAGSVIGTTVTWNSPDPNLGAFTGGDSFNFISNTTVINPVGSTIYALVTWAGASAAYGPLPAGTTLNPNTGVISGTLTTYQTDYTFSFTISATNGPARADRTFAGNVKGKPTSVIWNSPAPSLGTFNGGDTFNFVPDVSVTNPVGATTYSLVTGVGYGPLPAGTTLNPSTGVISGTLTRYAANTPYSFTIRATNNGKWSDRKFTANVVGTSVTWNSPSPNLGTFTGGDAVNLVSDTTVINPVGATVYALVTWARAPAAYGPLPVGTTLNPNTGVISGTLTTYQTDYPFSFTISATNGPARADRAFTGNVKGKPTTVNWNSPVAGNLATLNGGDAFNLISDTTVINPVGETTYSIVTGAIPSGTTLNKTTGVISGTLAGYSSNYNYSFTVRATNNGKWSDRLFTGTVVGTTITWNNPSSNLGTLNGGDTINLISDTTVINPVGATTYARVAGSLPVGATLNPTTGVISGTLTTYQTDYPISYTIRATNGPAAADRAFNGTIIGKPTSVIWNSPIAGNLGLLNGGTTFNFVPNVSVTNPVGATTYALISYNTIPSGTTFNPATGVIYGTLSNADSSWAFQVRATNNGKYADSGLFTGSTLGPTGPANGTSISWVRPSAGVQPGLYKVGNYWQLQPQITIIKQVGPIMYSVIGSLPPGIILSDPYNYTGSIIIGTPTTAGTYTFIVRVRNNGASANLPITITFTK